MRPTTLKNIVIHVLTCTAVSLCGCPAATPGDGTQEEQDQVNEALAVFTDTESTLRTNDVYDVENEIVRFDPANDSLVWVATDESFAGYPVAGDLIGASGFFQVRFGTVDGQRRAFFTEMNNATICNISVTGGVLRIAPTSVSVPQ